MISVPETVMSGTVVMAERNGACPNERVDYRRMPLRNVIPQRCISSRRRISGDGDLALHAEGQPGGRPQFGAARTRHIDCTRRLAHAVGVDRGHEVERRAAFVLA